MPPVPAQIIFLLQPLVLVVLHRTPTATRSHFLLLMSSQIVYLLRELWRGRSAREGEPFLRPGGDKALWRATGHLRLTRWDAAAIPTVDNLVCVWGRGVTGCWSGR